MSGKLSVYNIGSKGVNTDKNPLQLEDGELSKSQNAIVDPAGSDGGLRKRPGLTKVNGVAAAGSIKGAIGVPIAIGSAGNDAQVISAVGPSASRIIIGRRITSGTTGWNTSTDTFATGLTTGGPDTSAATATPRVPDNMYSALQYAAPTSAGTRNRQFIGRASVMYNNKLFYAGNDYTVGDTSLGATIHMYDGTQDFFICRVPAPTVGILNMVVGSTKVYLNTINSGTIGGNTLTGSIFQLDPESMQLEKMGSSFPLTPETVRVPYTLAWHDGKLWARTFGAGISALSHRVYWIRPDIDTDWTLDTTDAFESCNSMISFQGQLYMGIVKDSASASLIRLRSTLGVYSTTKTVVLNEGGSVPTMVSFGTANSFTTFVQFGGNLYAPYFNEEGAGGAGDRYLRIYKFDGTTWTIPYSPAKNSTQNVPYTNALVFGGRLYLTAASSYEVDGSAAANEVLYTSDGVTWTAAGSSVLANDPAMIIGGFAI